MISPRWHKVLSDLFSNKMRTILVVLSIAVGVFAVGFVSDGYLVLMNGIDSDYRSVNPHSALLYVSSFDQTQLNVVNRMPEVEKAEGRSGVTARVKNAQGKWVPIIFTAIPEIEKMDIDRIRPYYDDDSLVLIGREMFFECSGLSTLPVKPGDTLSIELANKRVKEIRVANLVRDVTAFPTLFSGQVNAYVSEETLEWLGGSPYYDRMVLTVAGDNLSEAHVRHVANLVSDKLSKGGHTVYATIVFKPGESPVSSVTKALLAMMGVLGSMAVFLSGFLVVNTVNALMTQHTRQIGVMKAVGGRSDQIVWMYLGMVTAFGVISLLVAIPLSAFTTHLMSGLLSDVLNFKPGPFRLSTISVLLQAAVALGVPIAASMLPVWKSTRLTIREAISNYGLDQTGFGQSRFDRVLEQVRVLPRPMLISLRNTFRKKGRLALTLSTLTLAGAIFIAVFNLKATFAVTIDQVLGYFLSDVNVSLNDSYRVERFENVAYHIPGVKSVETWGVVSGRVLSADGLASTEVYVWAPPNGSQLIQPVITEGRWLLPEDENAIVVGNHFLKKRPEVKVGDMLTMKVDEKEYRWKVVGVFLMAGNVEPPFVYVNNAYLSRLVGGGARASNYRIMTTHSDPSLQSQVAKELETRLEQSGMNVGQIITGADEQTRQAMSINILVYSLMAMALLIALVGGIGLMGTMSMNVLDRTREIGVMRSIGASDGTVLSMVMVEGVLIGTISWVLGSLLAMPFSTLLSDVVGRAFVQVPMQVVFSMGGFITWLLIIVFLSLLASFLPARSAVRLTVRDVLAYE